MVRDQRKSNSRQNDNREQEEDTECEASDREQTGRVHSPSNHGFPCCQRLANYLNNLGSLGFLGLGTVMAVVCDDESGYSMPQSFY